MICSPGAPLSGVYGIDLVPYSGNQWPTTATVTIATRSGTVSVPAVFAGPDSSAVRRVATVAFPAATVTPLTAAAGTTIRPFTAADGAGPAAAKPRR